VTQGRGARLAPPSATVYTFVAFYLVPQTRLPQQLDWTPVPDFAQDRLEANVGDAIDAALAGGTVDYVVAVHLTTGLRERVLVEAYARLQTIGGAGSILRLAFRKTLETELPSIRLLDGAENRLTPGQDSGAEGGAPPYEMRFAVEIVVRSDTDDLVGTDLNRWRDEVIARARPRPDDGPPGADLRRPAAVGDLHRLHESRAARPGGADAPRGRLPRPLRCRPARGGTEPFLQAGF
jgi:hypothetical protein